MNKSVLGLWCCVDGQMECGSKVFKQRGQISQKSHRILENQSDEIFESVEASMRRTLEFICGRQGKGIITFVI